MAKLSLIGAGVGESIAVELENDAWMVVDSCRHPETKRSAPLQHLLDAGVTVASSVRLIILTHWHDDHIAGAADLVDACTSATVVFSSALRSEEFGQLLGLYGDPAKLPPRVSRGLVEFRKIVQTLMARKRAGMVRPFVLAKADTTLFDGPQSKVTCLSPSDDAVIKSLAGFAEMTPEKIRRRMALHQKNPNHDAVALWVSWQNQPECEVLLGADLENTRDRDTGWDAVLQTLAVKNRKAHIFKIPHHGSKTGHHPEIWTDHIRENALGVLTTFNRGRSLPTSTDVARLKGLCGGVYATTYPKSSLPKRDPAVERTMSEVATYRAALHKNFGKVSIHQENDGALRAECFGDASFL